MAELPEARVVFGEGCPDCGERQIALPLPIPGVEDDFDWLARDYDSLRLFMMQELASRAPGRSRWTAADMEVVLVELLAAALDRMSHAMDRVQGERFLDTARRPGSVRRLLALIGHDPAPDVARATGRPLRDIGAAEIEAHWRADPAAMETARRDGPRRVREQRRLVTLADYTSTLEAHPLVALAQARLVWTGAWSTILVSTVLADGHGLDDGLTLAADGGGTLSPDLWAAVTDHHLGLGLPAPTLGANGTTARAVLRQVIEAQRMLGTEVFLEAARPAPVAIGLSVRAKPGYFRSEMRQALTQVFSAEPGGFFAPGRHRFGAALYASDIIEAAMGVEGAAVACLSGFRRLGRGFEDATEAGVLGVAEDEYIACRSDRTDPAGGRIDITVSGGELG